MDKYFIEYSLLIESTCNYLEKQLNYSKRRVDCYNCVFKKIRIFLFSQGYKHYSKEVGKLYVLSKSKDTNGEKLQFIFNAVTILDQFNETRQINFPIKKSKYPLVFDGKIGGIISHFIKDKIDKRMSRTNIQEHQRILFDFLNYLKERNINEIGQLDLALILHYIKQFKGPNKTNMLVMLRCLRGFTGYLYDNKHTQVNFSIKIPKEKRVLQPKIPSIYSVAEIKKLLASIDRSTTGGKRNFAIILIATRLGLRASDIANLKLENINWDNNVIVINQIKTSKELILPLFADIGNAIIDYLKYARPASNERHIFLTLRPPCMKFNSSNIITHVVQRAIIKAGLKIDNRRFGSHSLRHSLAFRLLEESTAINVISEVLGHENSHSTSYYLRVDLKSMRQCVLSVPPISERFYKQRGGVFYV